MTTEEFKAAWDKSRMSAKKALKIKEKSAKKCESCIWVHELSKNKFYCPFAKCAKSRLQK